MGKKSMDFNTQLSTKYVSHYTPKFEYLLKIIEEGFKPHRKKEWAIEAEETDTQKAFSSLSGEPNSKKRKDAHIPMVCFCDIPKKLIKQHVKEYGSYFIGLTKEWATKKGISPVIYVSQNSKVHTIIKTILGLAEKIRDIPYIPLQQKIYEICNFIKPYMNKCKTEKYYDEREWRYVPELKAQKTFLTFEKEDIRFIMVQTAKEKREAKKLLQEKFGDSSHIKILVSKKNTLLKMFKRLLR
jgi:NACalpha-BTF3-like transcription factor